jgi:MoxR-like ATPase
MREIVEALEAQLNTVVQGKPEKIRLSVLCLLAEGHLLIEDFPGLGKTTLARAIAASINGTFRRIQFTPDLMPTDITGVSIFRQDSSTFEFHPGPVFANIVLADEVNRASPRTQSALLEVMSERTVSYDGTTYPIKPPFMVVATQNPVELEGTYSLPEAQLDRFLMKINMGYPDRHSELRLLRDDNGADRLRDIRPVVTLTQLQDLVKIVQAVYVADAALEYIVRLVEATRNHDDVKLGCSPRSAIGLLRVSKASALVNGRDHVLPSDIADVATAVMSHRLVLHSLDMDSRDVTTQILNDTPVPPQGQWS